MTDLRVVQSDEGDEPEAAQGGYTVGDAAHSIAELAEDIRKRFKGFLPSDALKAVELAMGQHMAERQLAMAYPPLSPLPATEDIDVAERLAELGLVAGEDDPAIAAEIPTTEGY